MAKQLLSTPAMSFGVVIVTVKAADDILHHLSLCLWVYLVTPIAFDADRYPHEIHFYVTSLDDPESLKPEFHCHYDERLSWLEINDDLAKSKQVYSDVPNIQLWFFN